MLFEIKFKNENKFQKPYAYNKKFHLVVAKKNFAVGRKHVNYLINSL